jgi:hypothetical protein
MRVHICAELKQASSVNRTNIGIYVSIVLLKTECSHYRYNHLSDKHSQGAD